MLVFPDIKCRYSNFSEFKIICAINAALLRARIRNGEAALRLDRKSTRLNSSHTEIYTLSLHDALPIYIKCRYSNFSEFKIICAINAALLRARIRNGEAALRLRPFCQRVVQRRHAETRIFYV